MNIGKVAGRLVSTAKDPNLRGRTILLVRPLGGRERPFWALDAVGAGAGETVLYVRQRESAYAFLPDFVPCDAAIVGIVDEVREDLT
jgi:ethanolamine utilization protein EutN